MKALWNLIGITLALAWCIFTLGADVLDGSPAAIVTLLFALALPVIGIIEATKRRRRGSHETADAILTSAMIGTLTVAFVVAISDERVDHAVEDCGPTANP
jgi:hypothetical protein